MNEWDKLAHQLGRANQTIGGRLANLVFQPPFWRPYGNSGFRRPVASRIEERTGPLLSVTMDPTDFSLSLASSEERPLMVVDAADWDAQEARRDGMSPDRLRRWAEQVQWQLLSFHKGRIVQQNGHALVMEFADARNCLQAAFSLSHPGDPAGGRGKAKKLRMRAGAHLASYSPAQDEILGRDLHLTSGLTAVAKPGEVVVTAELRDRLADGVDAEFEDLGYRSVEPSPQPVRLFRAHPGGETSDWAEVAGRDLRPGLAVIPFQGGIPETRGWLIGELIAEGVIARLSHSIGLRVISRQSTSALRDRGGLAEIERHLGAAFVLSGSYSLQGRQLLVQAELAEAGSHTLLWSGRLQSTLDDILREESELLYELAHTVSDTLGKAQVRKAWAQPLPELDSSLLLLAGVSMTHSHSARTFERGRRVLTELTERHPGRALPRAWLGMWHVMSVVKGHSTDVGRDTRLAREQTLRALLAEPNNAMALAIEGHIQCQLLGNPEQARKALDAAIEANPSEPMAWLFKSLCSCMWGSSSASVTEAYIARSLSPVDPLRYYFDMLAGNALLADHQLQEAVASARRSLRANKHHAPTLRVLLTAQAELGQVEEGQATLGQLLAEVPGLTVSSYLAMGSTDSPLRQRMAQAMRQLGLPER